MLGVAQLPVGELHASLRTRGCSARRFLAFCSDEVVAGLLRLQRRLGIVERLLRHQRALEQLAGAVERLFAPAPARRCAFCTSGVFSIVGQVLRIGRAVLRERACQRRLLLVEAVLLLLAIELESAPAPP